MVADESFAKYRIGGAYHWKWYLVDFDGYRQFVDNIVGCLPRSGSVLDIGCGDGLMSYMFFRHGLDTVGIDSNEFAIRIADKISAEAAAGIYDAAMAKVMATKTGRQGSQFSGGLGDPELSFSCRSAYDLDEENKYDFAVCAEVIEHAEHPGRMLKNIHKVIRRFAIITTPDGTDEEPGPYDHQIWTPESFAEFLSGYNFETLDLRKGTIAVKLYKE